MRGFLRNIADLAIANTQFRHVLYTASHSQLVLQSLLPGQEIGPESHSMDQVFIIQAGEGHACIDGINRPVTDGDMIFVPGGESHNVRNSGDYPLKLYTIYSPPKHQDGSVKKTRANAEIDPEPFDGTTTEEDPPNEPPPTETLGQPC